MTNDGEIAVVENTTAPSIDSHNLDIMNVDDAKAFMDNYQELVAALLDKNDYQLIGEKKAKKRSAWRKLATAFNISDTIIDEDLVFDETNQIVKAKYTVEATLPNGRSAVGVGVCSIFDKIRYNGKNADTETPSNFELRGRFSNAEHDVPSTAHTRAKNRAISDLIGAGEVSSDELSEETKVVRNSKNTDNDVKEDTAAKTDATPRRRTRKRKTTVTEPEPADVIEAKAEVVTDEPATASKSKYHELAKNNSAIQEAIVRIETASETVSKNSIVEELFDLFDHNDIDMDEYDDAKKALESI